MKKVLCLLLLCIFMVINFSCHQPNIFATLEEADSLVYIYINPQKALGKLDSIEKVMDNYRGAKLCVSTLFAFYGRRQTLHNS